jgi:hypothetical protein
MPGANGENDEDALVVFPFEDMGMEGGSQINVPFNALFPYNALNAQVLQKVPHKPIIASSSAVSVYYSAAANPVDPMGVDSINSTSQNLFADGTVGANFDVEKTIAAAATGTTIYKVAKPTDMQTYGYAMANIAKTEFWDKIRQPNAAKLATPLPEKGLSQADTQNVVNSAVPKPMILPDQGIRGFVDKAAGVRAMPGIANPYKENKPQKLDYSAGQQSFVGQNIPATSVDDQGRTNPFTLMRVEAKDSSGAVKSAIDAVYTTASETGCVQCHYKGEKGSDDKVWRTPVTIKELLNADGTPGPATGKGEFPPLNPPTPVLTGDAIADCDWPCATEPLAAAASSFARARFPVGEALLKSVSAELLDASNVSGCISLAAAAGPNLVAAAEALAGAGSALCLHGAAMPSTSSSRLQQAGLAIVASSKQMHDCGELLELGRLRG